MVPYIHKILPLSRPTYYQAAEMGAAVGEIKTVGKEKEKEEKGKEKEPDGAKAAIEPPSANIPFRLSETLPPLSLLLPMEVCEWRSFVIVSGRT